jgi:hypothetical protein
MLFGCSKDNLIDTEQDSMVIEENNQTIINGEKGPIKDNSGVGTGLWLKGTSSDIGGSSEFIYWSENDDFLGVPVLKILTEGNFSGKLIGYGKINEINSTYLIEIVSSEENKLFGTANNCSGLYIYNIKVTGTIVLSDRDSSFFDFTLTGKFYINHDNSTINQVYFGVSDDNRLTGEINVSSVKFDNLKKNLKANIWSSDLTTGKIYLNIY